MGKPVMRSLFPDVPVVEKNNPTKWLGKSSAPWVLSKLSAEDLQELTLEDSDSTTSSPIKAEWPATPGAVGSPVTSPAEETFREEPIVRKSSLWRKRTLLTESTLQQSKSEDGGRRASVTDGRAAGAKEKPLISFEKMHDPADDFAKAVSGDVNSLERLLSDPTKLEVIPEAASVEAEDDAKPKGGMPQPLVSPFTISQQAPTALNLQRTASGNPFKPPANPLYHEAMLSGVNPTNIFDQDGCSALVQSQSAILPRTPIKQLSAPLDYKQLQLYASEPLPILHPHHSRQQSSASTMSDLSFTSPTEPPASDGYLERAGLVLPKPEPPAHVDVLIRTFSDYTQDMVVPKPKEPRKPMRSGCLNKAQPVQRPAHLSFPREFDSFGKEVAW